MVLPFNNYAKKVKEMTRPSGNTMNKKVRNAQLAQFIFIFVVGENESSNKTVNVRNRDNKVHGEFTLEAVLDKFQELVEQRILKSEDYGLSPPTEEEDKSKSATPVSE